MKELHYANASGAPSSDICAGCGTQRTLRQKLLRVARARAEYFIFPDVLRAAPKAEDAEDDGGVGFKGGKVLDAIAALYGKDKPVAVFDFGSLYPSIMRERNLCVTTRMTLQRSREMKVETAEIPPCPWADGVWVTPQGGRRTLGDLPEVNAAYSVDGLRAVLEDDGHVLRFDDGTAWQRDPGYVVFCLCCESLRRASPCDMTSPYHPTGPSWRASPRR